MNHKHALEIQHRLAAITMMLDTLETGAGDVVDLNAIALLTKEISCMSSGDMKQCAEFLILAIKRCQSPLHSKRFSNAIQEIRLYWSVMIRLLSQFQEESFVHEAHERQRTPLGKRSCVLAA